jgi:hypothetical protein
LTDVSRVDTAFVGRQSSAVFTVSLDGEAVLLDEVEHRLHHLNAPAALVWTCLDGEVSVAELSHELSDELGLPYETALADTLRIVSDLDAEGLLDGSPGPEADER